MRRSTLTFVIAAFLLLLAIWLPFGVAASARVRECTGCKARWIQEQEGPRRLLPWPKHKVDAVVGGKKDHAHQWEQVSEYASHRNEWLGWREALRASLLTVALVLAVRGSRRG